MAGGITSTGTISSSVHVKYEKGFIMEAAKHEVWSQFIDWQGVAQGDGGSSFQINSLEELNDDDIEALLPESTDIESTPLEDSTLTITPKEYGRVVTTTARLLFQTWGPLLREKAEIVGRNKTNTIEKAIRRAAIGGNHVIMPGGLIVRTDLDASSDLIDFELLTQAHAMALSLGIIPIDEQGNLAVIIHPSLTPDLFKMTEVKNVGYNMPADLMFRGEVAKFAGFRFIQSRFGKLYLAGGTTKQAATTLTAATVAGATTLLVANGSGLGNGDFVLVGAKEGNKSEMVQIVSGGTTTTLTVRGVGNGVNNTGLRWPHASGVSVLEAPNVAALVIVGKNSLHGRYGSEWGRAGIPVLQENLDKLKRFVHNGWKWYGGIGVNQKRVLRIEVATAQNIYGTN